MSGAPKCCWLPDGATEALSRPGMSEGDKCAWIARHGCNEPAKWTVHRHDPSNSADTWTESCNHHIGDLAGDGVNTIWPIGMIRAQTQNRPVLVSTSEYGPSPPNGEPPCYAVEMVGCGGGGGSGVKIDRIKVVAKDPDRWLADLDHYLGRKP